MYLRIAKLLAAASAVGLSTSAMAVGFVNGGFETGDFTGWTVQHGTYSGGVVSGLTTSTSTASVVGVGHVDPYSPFDLPFNGNYMAQLNTYIAPAGGRDVTRISQTATMDVGTTDLYINWGAVLEDPGHANSDEPFFSILVKKNGSTVYTVVHDANDGGWASLGNGPDGVITYYKSGQASVTGLTGGDSIYVELTVADCGLGGHAAWAYLDGIGNTALPPPPGSNIPDGGSTLVLLGSALAGLVAFKRRK